MGGIAAEDDTGGGEGGVKSSWGVECCVCGDDDETLC